MVWSGDWGTRPPSGLCNRASMALASLRPGICPPANSWSSIKAKCCARKSLIFEKRCVHSNCDDDSHF